MFNLIFVFLYSISFALGYSNIPGSIVLVQKNEQVVTYAKGMADIDKSIPMNTDILFPIASNTKMFTSEIIKQLIEEGKLRLADKAVKFLPNEVLSVLDFFPDISNVTILDLLRHSSGIPDYLSQGGNEVNAKLVEDIMPFIKRSKDKILLQRSYLQLTWIDFPTNQELYDPLFILGYGITHRTFDHLRFGPGEKSEYSNTNYLLLGLIIENLEKNSLQEVFSTRIIKKLGLSSTFLLNRERSEYQLAPLIPYIGKMSFSSYYSGLVGYADDGIISTLNELNLFLRYYLRDLKYFDDLRFFGNESSENSTGIMIKKISGVDVYYHTGEDPGVLSISAYIPRCNLSIIAMINQSDKNGKDALGRDIIKPFIQEQCD